jgi:SSS family transporter
MPPADPHSAALSLLDWLVVGAYFALLAATGWIISRRAKSAGDYFVAHRDMPMWAVAISVVATAVSGATFIAGPAQSYSGDLSFLSAQIGQVLAIVIVALFFVPAFYKHRVATIYQLIEDAFGPLAKQTCSWMFMLGRVFASGARLYIAAFALARVLFGVTDPTHIAMGISIVSIVGVLYTLIGGIRAVIWTDVIQTIVFIGAAIVAIVVLLHRIPSDVPTIYRTLAESRSSAGTSKLAILNTSASLGSPFTLWTALIGFTIFNVAAYGTDHDLAQRMLTCRSAAKGSQSAIGAILVSIPVTLLFMLAGLLLYIFYQKPALMGSLAPSEAPEPAKEVFLWFILREMPRGLAGLMIAGLLAASLSSLTSALNALSATLIHDVYQPRRPARFAALDLRAGQVAMCLWGVVLGGFAYLCIFWERSNASIGGQTLLEFALSVMTFAYAGLAAVFVAAIFTNRGNGTSAIAALATGFIVVLLGQPAIYKAWASHVEWTTHTPTSQAPGTLADTSIAWPWVLTAAFVLAFLVCIAGRRKSMQTQASGDRVEA